MRAGVAGQAAWRCEFGCCRSMTGPITCAWRRGPSSVRAAGVVTKPIAPMTARGVLEPAAVETPVPGALEDVGRILLALAASGLALREGRPSTPVETLRGWGQAALAEALLGEKARAAKALSATTASEGGFLVPTQMSREVIPALRATSLVRRLGAATLTMPVGSLRIPKIVGGGSAGYIAENGNITASQPILGQVAFVFRKLAALVPISNSLVRVGVGEDIVAADLVQLLASAENPAFLLGDGTAGRPRGLRNWAVPGNIATSAGTSLANILTDLGSAVQALRNARVPEGRWAWFMSPRSENTLKTILTAGGYPMFAPEMNLNGTLWGYPFGVSTDIPGTGATGELYLANLADCVIAESERLEVSLARAATYVDSAGQVVSAFQQDQSVIRVIAEHDFAVRRGESVAVIVGLSW